MKIRALASEAQKQSEEERKKKRNKYLGIALLVIMAISSIGYAFLSSSPDTTSKTQLKEGLFEQNGQWFFKQGQVELAFNIGPEEVKNISSNINLTLNDFAQKKVYAVDKERVLIGYLMQNIGKFTSVGEACLGKCDLDLPEKNCTSDYLIVWNRTADNSLTQKEKCIFINGDINALDAFVYRVFGLV